MNRLTESVRVTASELPPLTVDMPPCHARRAIEVLAQLASDAASGLTRDEVQLRLARYGPNRLPPAKRRPPWLRFLLQFHNVLIYVMLAAAATTATLGHLVDTAVLLAAVVVNACIGYVQEGKAESALGAIRDMLSLRAAVIRGGERAEITAEDIVPGDIVLVASGDKVPADVRLVTAKNLRVDEAALTGESEPAEKAVEPVAADAVLADRRCMLYSGTMVVHGQGTGVAVATGGATELGRISAMLEQVEATATPLLRQMATFSRWLAAVILLMAAGTFVLGIHFRGHAPSEMFVMVVALAASAIPEGLPAIMTITLALGVQRMAKRNAIIRQLPAVETLGSVTVICSDKTGTLTRNEMTVQRVITSRHVFEVTGSGYAPHGGFHLLGQAVSAGDFPALREIARAGLLCNEAVLRHTGGEWLLHGDPTEGALIALALKAGLQPETETEALPRDDAIPFESEHRFMATLNRDHQGERHIYMKGAPERILDVCDAQRVDGGRERLDPDYWRRWAVDAAARGQRVLAIAIKRASPQRSDLTFADVESGFTLLALLGITDPPRDEAVAAVAECAAAGISVKMITGDHVETARAIGSQLGIGRDKPALTGAEIEIMDDEELRRLTPAVDVYARASPEHKLRLVQAMQANGQRVAMTGDGVNDAPALKRADVGVAMGRKGTEAAKEAADMVLADDNFATIANAVREGRGIYDNIRKFVLFMLPTNGGEALVVGAAILFDLVLPLTPAQVLWINMATSSTLGLALAFEATEADVMRRPPRNPREPLLSWFFAWRVLMVSILMMTGALGLFLWEIGRGASIETARTMAVSAVVVAEMFYLVNSRYIYRSVLSREGLFGSRHVLLAIAGCAALQLAYTHAAPLQEIFGSTHLAPDEWLRVVAAGAFVFCMAELEKQVICVRRGPYGEASPASQS